MRPVTFPRTTKPPDANRADVSYARVGGRNQAAARPVRWALSANR